MWWHSAGVAAFDESADHRALFGAHEVVCTADVSSSDGIGASISSALRSDSTMTRAPLSIACVTSSKIVSSAARNASPRRRAIQALDDVGLSPGYPPSSSAWMILANSSLSRLGTAARAAAVLGTGLEEVGLRTHGRCGTAVTTSSRSHRAAVRGPARTAAGSIRTRRGRSDNTAIGVSVPSSRSARRRLSAIGATMILSSSCV